MQIQFCYDKDLWNRSILNLGGGLYHSWQWGEVRKAEGWIPWRVLGYSDGVVCAGAQILQKPLPMKVGCLLYIPRGVAGCADPSIVKQLVVWLKVFLHERRGIVLRMDPDFPDVDESRKAVFLANGLRSLPDEWSFWNMQRSSMVVDIGGAEPDILEKMRKKHREHINRALRTLTFETEFEVTQLREFYGLLLKSSQRQGFLLRGFDHLRRVRDELVMKGQGMMWLARSGERAVAGILCTHFGSVSHYLYGGFDWEARQLHATEALHWKAIQWAKGLGCTSYNLMGTGTRYPPKESNRGYGLYHYKKGFGADLHHSVAYFDLPAKPLRYRLLRFCERHPRLIVFASKLVHVS
jgi:lipid II:glycine glycyltransferase (peptidoglycan interpeptide bridge formation enzyme)